MQGTVFLLTLYSIQTWYSWHDFNDTTTTVTMMTSKNDIFLTIMFLFFWLCCWIGRLGKTVEAEEAFESLCQKGSRPRSLSIHLHVVQLDGMSGWYQTWLLTLPWWRHMLRWGFPSSYIAWQGTHEELIACWNMSVFSACISLHCHTPLLLAADVRHNSWSRLKLCWTALKQKVSRLQKGTLIVILFTGIQR